MSRYVLPPPPGKFIEVRGHRLHYREEGPRDAPPIVAVHGILASDTEWDKVRSAFAEKFRFISFDLPGHGYSSRNEDFSMRLADQAEVVVAFADELGLSSYRVLGHSMGGAISLALTANNQARVEKLVVVSPAAFPFEAPLKGRLGAMPVLGKLLVYYVYRKALFRNFLRNDVYFDPRVMEEKEPENMYAHFKSPASRKLAQRAMVDVQDPRWLAPLVRSIKTETLVLWGREDKLVPLHVGETLDQNMESSRLVVFEKCGHMPMNEVTNDFLAEVLPFFEG